MGNPAWFGKIRVIRAEVALLQRSWKKATLHSIAIQGLLLKKLSTRGFAILNFVKVTKLFLGHD